MNLQNEPLYALSWKEPFATLMLYGKIETRVWSTNYRGLVLICATVQSYPIKVQMNITGKHFGRMNQIFTDNKLDLNKTQGHAIAIGRLVDCRKMKPDDEEKTFVRYYPNLYCHVYEDVKPIEPIPWKGCQKWKIVPKDVIDKIQFKQIIRFLNY